MTTERAYPVHPTVEVHSGETIYRTDTWWKAAVSHSYKESDSKEIAIYLWHHDGDDWSRKNKYHVKAVDAWQSDRALITEYLHEQGKTPDDPAELPVSDYYHVAQGETVFKTDDWWKAIVGIDKKGSYDTHEVIIYLWQNTDKGWKRRQKYAVKDIDDWEDDFKAVESLLGETSESGSNIQTVARAEETTDDSTPGKSGSEILGQLQHELEAKHVGSEVTP